ncbi:unnamed protein product [Diabrotica balteata]|uniref:Odorant receptor n=1 Tax=Diabrotica balteata TaxID=107213 RepID=A0A9N9XCT0_DIABA|nr:unnamed protein product [Diabrotica balteata]
MTFTKQLNNEMNPLELYQLAESLGSDVEQAGSYLYLIGFSMQLFIDCFFGTFLYHQASLLPDAIFHSNWRTLDDEELKKDFVFLLQNSQRIPQFNAYNVYDMHMMSFIKGMYKVVILWYKSDELKSVFHIILTDFWPYDLINLESKRKIKDMYRLMNGLVWWFFCAGFLYASMFLIPSLFSNRGLPYVVSYPFDWTVSPWYEIIYCIQAFAHGITISFIGTGANFLVLGTLLNISSQYCILQECFEIFNTPEMYATNKKLRKITSDGLENKYTDERKEYFVRCVRHHQLILRFTKQLNNAMNPLELYQLAESLGSVAEQAASLLPDAIFHSNWRTLEDEELRKDFVFLLQNSQRIPQFNAYNVYDMHMVSFIKGMYKIFILWYKSDEFKSVFHIILNDFWPYDLINLESKRNVKNMYRLMNGLASLLPDAIFHSNWRTLEDEELRKDFVFLLQNSQRIPQFNAYNVYDMHMMSFIKVIKVAFSFYTMLSKLK